MYLQRAVSGIVTRNVWEKEDTSRKKKKKITQTHTPILTVAWQGRGVTCFQRSLPGKQCLHVWSCRGQKERMRHIESVIFYILNQMGPKTKSHFPLTTQGCTVWWQRLPKWPKWVFLLPLRLVGAVVRRWFTISAFSFWPEQRVESVTVAPTLASRRERCKAKTQEEISSIQ